jgi:hypothetical protein
MFDLTYLLVGLPFVFAVVFGFAACVLFFVCCRWPTAGMVVVSVLFLTEALLPGLPPVYVGIQLYLPDLVTVFLGSVALARFIGARPRPAIPLSWYLFLVVIGVSFAFGVSRFGVAAGTALRTYFYALAVASYAMTFITDESTVQRLFATLAWVGSFLLFVVVVRWVVVAVPINALLPEGGRFSSSEASILRVIASEEAVVLAQLLVVMLFFPQVSPTLRRLRFLLPLLFIAIVVLQHRSVWLACFAGIVMRFVLPAAGRRGVNQVIALVLATAVIAIPFALSGRLNLAATDVAQSADRAATLSDTARGRLDSWKFLFDKWREGGVRSVVIGQPLGTSMDRNVLDANRDSRRIVFSAHNYYIQTLFNTGIVGLGASLFLFFWVELRLYQLARDPVRGPTASALFLLVGVQMAYYLPYGIHYIQGLILGVAVAYLQTVRRKLPAAVPVAQPMQRTPLGRGRPGLGGSVL